MGSKPELRDAIVESLKDQPNRTARATTIEELKRILGINDSNGQVSRAIRSEHYNHGRLTLGRPRVDDSACGTSFKTYVVTLR